MIELLERGIEINGMQIKKIIVNRNRSRLNSSKEISCLNL